MNKSKAISRFAKIEAERICREYRNKGLDVIILRPRAIVGETHRKEIDSEFGTTHRKSVRQKILMVLKGLS